MIGEMTSTVAGVESIIELMSPKEETDSVLEESASKHTTEHIKLTLLERLPAAGLQDLLLEKRVTLKNRKKEEIYEVGIYIF